jgi:hypothetical protein
MATSGQAILRPERWGEPSRFDTIYSQMGTSQAASSSSNALAPF